MLHGGSKNSIRFLHESSDSFNPRQGKKIEPKGTSCGVYINPCGPGSYTSHGKGLASIVKQS